MIRKSCIAFVVVLLAFSVLTIEGWTQARTLYQQTQYKGQEIGKLTGDVYYARMDDYVSAFMVTSEGIVLVEPIGTEMAAWLKAELTRRFKVPVKYVIYSHSHWDHASGGSVYADTARFVGQENMLKNIAMPPASTPLTQNTRAQDTNGNGRIEKDEAQGNIRSQFELYDANKDGVLTGAEVTRGPIANVRHRM
jgi:glyoxylase-like metal-dependent hydrolase (beta-lactamase superfamily II)